jgi:hypothetical protein
LLLSIDAKNKEFKLLPEQKDAEELANINCVDNGAENVPVNIKKFTNFIDEPSPPRTNAVVASSIQQHISLMIYRRKIRLIINCSKKKTLMILMKIILSDVGVRSYKSHILILIEIIRQGMQMDDI